MWIWIATWITRMKEAIEERQRAAKPVEERRPKDRAPQAPEAVEPPAVRPVAPQPVPPDPLPAVALAFPFEPVASAALPDVPALTAAVDPEATEARRLRRQRDEEALALLLAELA